MSDDDDRSGAERDLNEQARWGEGFQDRALRRVLAFTDKFRVRLSSLEDDRTQMRTQIQDLRDRVRALESKLP